MSRSGSHSHSSRSGSERLQTSGEAEEIILRVGSPAHGGHCVARLDDDPAGRVVFVRHALPGEVVRAVLTEKSAKIWRADAVEVLSASPDRVRSVWREAGPGEWAVGNSAMLPCRPNEPGNVGCWPIACGASAGRRSRRPWPALPEAAGTGAVPVEAMPSEAAAEAGDDPRARRLAGTGTRTRIALTITDDGLAGMHGFRSGTVLPVTSLPLAVSTIRALGLTERALWRAHYRPGMRVHAVAPSSGDPVVRLSSGRWEQLLTPTGRVTGRRRVEEVVGASGLGLGELRYSVHAEGFWQIHRDAPAVLVDRIVRAALSSAPTAAGTKAGDAPLDSAASAGVRVVELYAGAGLFTLPLAMLTGTVRSLEGKEQAVRDARRSLHSQQGARLFAGGVTPDSVAELGCFTPDGGQGADVVVLDPPRQGAGRQIVEAIAALGPDRIVMASCDPAALARDLKIFMGTGYRLAALSALDMFPHTHHFETIAVLGKR